MFEVLLGTRGIMQLGWATVKCQFTNEVNIFLVNYSSLFSCLNFPIFCLSTNVNILQEGVGDTEHSYAYDGHRVRKWNLSASAYGEVCE